MSSSSVSSCFPSGGAAPFVPAVLPSGLLRGESLPPAIMVLGTASNAGKSLLAAGLCRLFARRGLRVAPFKAQNMALNAAVTPDGGEIGRAQALQARACGLLPDVRMNPVLLKPESDCGSQVVVLGRGRGSCRAREYEAMKPALFREVCRAYAELAVGRDLMILEGAGSPAEINLRDGDIVNSRMAREARARVVLAGDIDRGGVFAALLGTLSLMEPWERDLVAGLVINKFRGDPSLLPPALDEVSARTGKPFLGVVPWLDGLILPEEDSVGLRSGSRLKRGIQPAASPGVLDVAVIDLPRAANMADVDPLVAEPGVRVRLASGPAELGDPDLVILPGSRSSASDLRRLRESGMADAVRDLVLRPGGPDLLGICGGMQMMGLRLDDPLGLEEPTGHSEPGLAVLPLITVMARDKTLRRELCRDVFAGPAPGRGEPLMLHGYEIHNGRTRPAEEGGGAVLAPSPEPWMLDADGEVMGWTAVLAAGRDARGNRAWVTYAHGLFDDDGWRAGFLDDLRRRRGLPARPPSRYSVEPSLDRLADVLEERLDLRRLASGLGLPR